MKSTIAYYLLLLYVTVMLKPLAPVVSDALSHTFNQTIHIATVHAKYGNNHLAVAVASAASEDNNKNQQTTIRFEEAMPVHIAQEPATIAFNLITTASFFGLLRVKKCTAIYLQIQIPPPKFFLQTSIAQSIQML